MQLAAFLTGNRRDLPMRTVRGAGSIAEGQAIFDAVGVPRHARHDSSGVPQRTIAGNEGKAPFPTQIASRRTIGGVYLAAFAIV